MNPTHTTKAKRAAEEIVPLNTFPGSQQLHRQEVEAIIMRHCFPEAECEQPQLLALLEKDADVARVLDLNYSRERRVEALNRLLVDKNGSLAQLQSDLATARAEVDKLTKLADGQAQLLKADDRQADELIEERDIAEIASDKLASAVLGEPIDWSDHEAKWSEALEEVSALHTRVRELEGALQAMRRGVKGGAGPLLSDAKNGGGQ